MSFDELKGTGRILVMDDEASIRGFLGSILSELGYKAGFSANGEECIKEYTAAMQRGERYDVVIMDLTIAGGMGGRDTISELKKIDPSVKGLVSSGYSSDPIMSDFASYGFSGALAKPYVLDELAAELKRLTSSK